MALKALLITIVILASMAPAFAMDYMIDWNLGVNYTEWTAGREFHVGDTLTFMYTQGDHNVYSVSGADFKACNTSNALRGPFNSGNDMFNLTTPGKRWYVCGIGSHCLQGMKVVIAVIADGPAPAPAPSAAGQLTPFNSFAWMLAAAMAALWMNMA